LKKVIETDKEKYISITKEDNGFKEIMDHEKFKALITDHMENK
jgi:hypothetical protein